MVLAGRGARVWGGIGKVIAGSQGWLMATITLLATSQRNLLRAPSEELPHSLAKLDSIFEEGDCMTSKRRLYKYVDAKGCRI
jgi:hypothetical protein